MAQQPDDLEAVRQLVTTLEKFDKPEQERIIRWAREKLGLTLGEQLTPVTIPQNIVQTNAHEVSTRNKDLKSFVNEKNPSSDMQFAVTVAYYYKFESPESEKKDSINSEILQDAARLAGRRRLGKPSQTLVNASFNGMLDKSDEKGAYKINTVGENLVAMTLPSSGGSKTIKKNKKAQKKKSVKKNLKKK